MKAVNVLGLTGGFLSALLVQAPHQRLPHPGHGLHVVAHLFQLVQHHSGRLVHDVLRAATGTQARNVSPLSSHPDVGISLLLS